jgi:hypothetical protein
LKLLTLIIFLAISPTLSFGQLLFFDNIKNSSWIVKGSSNDSIFKKCKEIGLRKLEVLKDSLKTNMTIWTFKDQLSVSYYKASIKKDSIMVVYNYDIDNDEGILKIIPDDENPQFHQQERSYF